jgi:hypothetical protein
MIIESPALEPVAARRRRLKEPLARPVFIASHAKLVPKQRVRAKESRVRQHEQDSSPHFSAARVSASLPRGARAPGRLGWPVSGLALIKIGVYGVPHHRPRLCPQASVE